MQLHPARIQFQYVIAPYRRAIGLRMSLRAQMCGEGKRFEVSGLTSTSNPIPCVIFLSNILQGPWQHLEGSRYTSELLLTCHWLTGILGLPWWATLDTLISKISPWTLWPKGRRPGNTWRNLVVVHPIQVSGVLDQQPVAVFAKISDCACKWRRCLIMST